MKQSQTKTTATRSINTAAIPAELKALPQWVCWREETRGNGKMAKPPIDPKMGGKASVTNPLTWATYEEALEYYEEFKEHGCCGIGFMLTACDHYTGIDLDKCRNSETGEIDSWAMEVIKRLASFTEESPSGTGIHVWVRGNWPSSRNRSENIEVYDHKRYFTVTGDILPGSITAIEDRQAELNALHVELFGTGGGDSQEGLGEEDAALIAQARAKYGAKYEGLWDGDSSDYDSQSSADLALCNMLAQVTGRNPDLVDELFRQSGLMRDKWDERHYADGRTYGEATVEKACAAEPSEVRGKGRGCQIPGGFNCTDQGNGQRLVARHGRDLRYLYPWKKWLVWDGRRWTIDDTGEVQRRAKETVQSIYAEASEAPVEEVRKALAKHAAQSESEARRRSMIAAAQSEDGVAVRPEDLDTDPWLLNCLNGTIDLRTGRLGPHRRENLITKLSPVEFDAEAGCPAWLAFLRRVLADSDELIAFIQKAIGYSLTGLTREQCFFILYGLGANGKTTMLETIKRLLSDYAAQASMDTFLAKSRDGGVPNDIAALRGARLVTAVEAEKGHYLSEALIKRLTGEDEIAARFLYCEVFTYRPQCKIWLGTNHKPVIRGGDYAIWRRVHLIPFTVKIPDAEQDRDLQEKLRQELPGILNWAVEGCLRWRAEGLEAPAEVHSSTKAYQDEMDVLGDFLEERCITGSVLSVPAADLFKAYTSWAEANGDRTPLNQQSFGTELTSRGFDPGRGSGGKRLRLGLQLKA
jgi:putative DNA primase/helicase